MKKLFGFLLILVITAFIAPVVIMAQEGGGGFDPAGYVATFAVYVVTLLAAVEIIMTLVKGTGARKIVIWVVAVVLGVLAFALKLGIFYTTWYVGLLYVILGGAVGSGYLTTEQGQMLIDLILNLFKSKETLKKEAAAREVALKETHMKI